MISREEISDFLDEAENSKHPLVFCEGLPIGQQIRIKRAHDQLSIRGLAEMIKVPKTTLSKIESGKRSIAYKYKKSIDDYLYHMYFDGGEYVEWWD